MKLNSAVSISINVAYNDFDILLGSIELELLHYDL